MLLWRILADGGERFSQQRATEVSPLTPERRFWLAARVETLPDGGSLYRVKQWNAGGDEPEAWAVESRERAGQDLTSGSVLVVPHHTDVTLHELHVAPLGSEPLGESEP